MSFNNKLDSFFREYSFEYKNKPTKNKTYIYSDYIELLALFSNDTIISPSDFLDRLEEKFPLDKRFFVEEDDILGVTTVVSEEDNLSDDDKERASLNDLKQTFAESIFRISNERSIIFGDNYPFNSTGKNIQLKTDLTIKQKTYLILLMCSSLDIFYDFMNELTKEFESISYLALKNFFPEHGIVKSFGKNCDYSETYARQKIRSLARDMKIKVKESALMQISPNNRQEKGLDLIGWIPFEDNIPNFLCVLAQCACQKEFNGKLAESLRYKRYLKFHVLQPISSIFIPYSLINDSSAYEFTRFDEISVDTLLFERKRILNYLNDEFDLNNLDSYKLVNKCIEYLEELT